jgi:hypothetical protein
MRQTQIDVSIRLGMRFQEGWRYPLIIGFVDRSPHGVENALAYVQLMTDGQKFLQQLNVNLAAYERDNFNFKKVFAHELVHAMINDAMGGNASSVLPLWFHEGLAVFGADQGEQMIKSYVYQTSGFSESQLLNGIETHRTGYDYAEDYWAIKYIYEKIGPNHLHNFVREVIKRRGDIPGALQYTCFISWDQYQKKVTEFAKDEIERIGPRRKGKYKNPY